MSHLHKYIESQVKDRFTPHERARIWCDLNRYEWPAEFENVRPDCWESATRKDKNRMPIFIALWNAIVKHTDYRDCLRAWNCEMTDEEFDAFWEIITHEFDQ